MTKKSKPITTSTFETLNAFNLVQKDPIPVSKIDKSENITVWEIAGSRDNNNFPQQLLQNVYNSPVGSAAIDLWQEFVEGAGFVSEDIGKIKVNKAQTMNDLHALVSADLASMWGLSIQVGYDSNGKRTEFNHLPFESARLGALDKNGRTDRIYYNPYYGTPDYDKKFTTWYYDYNPDPEAVKSQMLEHTKLLEEKKVNFAYPGQVYWFSIERPLARIYPQPFYYSAISWFQVDAAIQKFHSRNIDNNFLLSVLINKFGNPDTPAGPKDDDENFTSTAGEEFTKDMKAFAGADSGGAALVNWYQRTEQKADITSFPTNANDTLFLTLQNLVSDQIAIGTKTPRILLGIATAGKLGDTQDILNSVKVMQARTKRMREILKRVYLELFLGFGSVNQETDFTIQNVNPFDILPDWVVNALSKSQKDKYISENFNIDFEKQTTDDPVQAAAQAGMILSIKQGVYQGLTTQESALEGLKLIYGFSNDEAAMLLGIPKEEPSEASITANLMNKVKELLKIKSNGS